MTGERQTGETLDAIRSDHKARYEFAKEWIIKNECKRVLDIGCGIGYGSFMIADYVDHITAIDISKEAYEIYKDNYRKSNIDYRIENILEADLTEHYDVVLAFEFLEHIQEDVLAVQKVAKISDAIIGSAPNELKRPYRKNTNPYHFRHYTPREFKKLLKAQYPVLEKLHVVQRSNSTKVSMNRNGKGKFLVQVAKKK